VNGLGVGITLDYGRLTPGAGSVERALCGDCGHVTPGEVSVRCFLPGKSGQVTQNAMSGVEADPGACGCVKPGEVSGRWAGEVSGRWGHYGECGRVNLGAGSGRVFTLETMDM